MRRRWRTSSTAMVVVAAAVTSLVGAAAPAAAVDGDPQVIASDTQLFVRVLYAAGRTVTIECIDGKLAVNDEATTLSCADAKQIVVFGSPGPDVLDLSSLTAAEVPLATFVRVSGEAGTDDIRGPGVPARLTGGGEADHITGGIAGDIIDGAGDLFPKAADVIDAGDGDDQITSTAGAQIDAGPCDDRITAQTVADAPAALDGGPDVDTFALGSADAAGHVVLAPRPDGSIDVVDSSPAAVGLMTVPSGFEAFELSAAGGDLVSVDGLSPTVPMQATVVSSGNARLEVFAKGPFTQTSNEIDRPGFAPITFTGFAGAIAFGTPTSPEHVFVHAAAHDLNGAHLSPEAVDTVATQIQGGSLTRTGYAERLTATLIWRQNEVRRMYAAYLHRTADPTGRDLYSEKIRTGVLANSIRATLIGSDEYYRRRADSQDKYFVVAVYRDVLGRRTDGEGGRYWRERLSHGLSRRQMAVTFLQSAEGVRSIIRYHFRDLLGRDPSADELSAWATAIHDQASGERDLQVSLVASDEYLARQQ